MYRAYGRADLESVEEDECNLPICAAAAQQFLDQNTVRLKPRAGPLFGQTVENAVKIWIHWTV